MQAKFTDVFDRERQIASLNHEVRTLTVRANVSKFVYVQLHTGAVTQAASDVVAGSKFNLGAQVDAGHSAERFLQDIGF